VVRFARCRRRGDAEEIREQADSEEWRSERRVMAPTTRGGAVGLFRWVREIETQAKRTLAGPPSGCVRRLSAGASRACRGRALIDVVARQQGCRRTSAPSFPSTSSLSKNELMRVGIVHPLAERSRFPGLECLAALT
jgi:hypothetical protein